MVSKAMDVLQAVDNNGSRERRWKGVRKRAWGRYVCEIRLPRSRQRIWLGSYATAEEAACAYDAASLCLRGTSASLNFPSMSSLLLRDSVSSQLPLSREAIQSIAAAAAAQCRKPQPDAVVAEKLQSTLEEPPLSSNTSRAQKCAQEHSNRRQGSPILLGPNTPNQSDRPHLRKKEEADLQQDEADEPQLQASSVPAEQSSGPEEILGSATGAEDDQCLFSILKELIALPMIFNSCGAPIC